MTDSLKGGKIIFMILLIFSCQVEPRKKGKDRTIILGGGGSGSAPPQILSIPIPIPYPVPISQAPMQHSYQSHSQSQTSRPQIIFLPAYHYPMHHNFIDSGWDSGWSTNQMDWSGMQSNHYLGHIENDRHLGSFYGR
ncbi:uncharacterized protein LOC141851699 [Brevipalpus obovatus]|uniref:uncharacterized protein LOC141851699 n=1 Tax=Brevipalpus obovatus TaxID=246614 RepID=UPI003D9ED08B